MQDYIQFIKSHFLPGECYLCQNSADITLSICQRCISNLTENKICCSQCATPLNSSHDDCILLCGQCQKHKRQFEKVFSPFLYQGDMVQLIQQFKYHSKLYMGKTLAKLFLQKYFISHSDNDHPQLIIPVPLHEKRLKYRGFNQSYELARYFSKKLTIPIEANLVSRVKLTHTQKGLSFVQRKANLKDAFTTSDINFSQKHIVLVDDVMTTGNTVNEVAKVLKRAGAKRVDVWAIARA